MDGGAFHRVHLWSDVKYDVMKMHCNLLYVHMTRTSTEESDGEGARNAESLRFKAGMQKNCLPPTWSGKTVLVVVCNQQIVETQS